MSPPAGAGPHLDAARLDALADESLADGAERDDAARHVAGCAACRAELAAAREVLALARAARGGVPAPPELWPLVAASTVHAARLRRRTLRALRGVLVLGGLALVLATAAVTALVLSWRRPSAPASGPASASSPEASAPSGSRAPAPPRPPPAPRPPAPPRPR